MNSIVSFKSVDVSRDGVIECVVLRDGTPSDFYIRLPYSFQPDPDLLAATFVSVVGQAFEQIHIDLPIGPSQLSNLEAWSGSQLVAHPGKDRRRKRGTRQALNFSGGFDSLAAQILVPSADLISLDFGGRFSRERRFFDQFDPYTFETNLVDIGLNRYSWTFMGIGSILLRDELDLGGYSFGSIMAGTAKTLVSAPSDQRLGGLRAAVDLGMQVENPVAGLSEIASMKLVALNMPDILVDILQSVALPQEEKFLRKYQMLGAISADLGLSLDLSGAQPKRPQGMKWGYSAASDLSSLYTMATLGVEPVLAAYPEGVPDRFIQFVKKNRMHFMNRINPHAYLGASKVRVADWYSKLISNGITPFERQDWDDMSSTMELFR